VNTRTPYPRWTVLTWTLILPTALIGVGLAVVVTTQVGDLPFDNGELWWLVFGVPLASLVTLYGTARKRAALTRFASERLSPLLVARFSPGRAAMRGGLRLLALVMLVGAILGPRWGMYLQEQEVRGIDVAVVVDVSNSMLARDVAPSRMAKAKEQIRQQLTERSVFDGQHRLALMAFAGSTSTRLPLTTDQLAFREKLRALRVHSVARGGTDIGRAIDDATDLFARSPEQATKIILLVTDGEDQEGHAIEAAKRCYEEHGISIFTVGVGDAASTAGAQVPSAPGRDGKPLLYDGQLVFSKLDVEGLRQIAQAGHGRYTPLEHLNLLVSALAGMRKTALSTEQRMRHQPRYQYFLAVALVLLAAETCLGQRRPGTQDRFDRVWQQETT